MSIKKIIDEAASFSNLYSSAALSDFIAHLDMAFNNNISICIDKDDYVQNAIQLLSLHGSKGREFEFVFIPNLTSKNWEKKRSPNGISLPIQKISFSEDDEQAKKAELLRLLFVGITRSKYGLMLSYANSINGKSQELTSYLAQVTNNETLTHSHNEELNKDDYTLEIAKSIRQLDFNHEKAFKDELMARLKDFRLSPSTLNSYLNCPRNFLYSHIYKIPVEDQDTNNANYGSAIHKTLEWSLVVAKENGNYPAINECTDTFIKKLANYKFPTFSDRKEFEKRGIKSLTSYYPIFTYTSPDNVLAIESKLDSVLIEDYFITGFIDRVEKNNDGTYSLYDYKTGSAKPKSQIADGKEYEHYLNQLRFYKFAYETLNQGAKVSQVGLIFVDEPEASYYTKLSQDDNDLIKDKIITSYKSIHALNFEVKDTETQKNKACEYCNYKMLCRLNII